MTVALLWMVNPLWELLLAPGLLVGLGWWLRGKHIDDTDDGYVGYEEVG